MTKIVQLFFSLNRQSFSMSYTYVVKSNKRVVTVETHECFDKSESNEIYEMHRKFHQRLKRITYFQNDNLMQPISSHFCITFKTFH